MAATHKQIEVKELSDLLASMSPEDMMKTIELANARRRTTVDAVKSSPRKRTKSQKARDSSPHPPEDSDAPPERVAVKGGSDAKRRAVEPAAPPKAQPALALFQPQAAPPSSLNGFRLSNEGEGVALAGLLQLQQLRGAMPQQRPVAATSAVAPASDRDAFAEAYEEGETTEEDEPTPARPHSRPAAGARPAAQAGAAEAPEHGAPGSKAPPPPTFSADMPPNATLAPPAPLILDSSGPPPSKPVPSTLPIANLAVGLSPDVPFPPYVEPPAEARVAAPLEQPPAPPADASASLAAAAADEPAHAAPPAQQPSAPPIAPPVSLAELTGPPPHVGPPPTPIPEQLLAAGTYTEGGMMLPMPAGFVANLEAHGVPAAVDAYQQHYHHQPALQQERDALDGADDDGDDGAGPSYGGAEGTTKYTGVRQNKGGRFSARIKIGGTNKYIGTFKTAEEAARAFDAEAIKHGRPVETLNFPASHGGPTVGQAYRKRKLHKLYEDPNNSINLLLKKLADVDRSNPGILKLTMATLGVPESRFQGQKYSGVRQQTNHWEARIRYKDKLYSMGFYSSIEAAALAWDITAASLRRCSKLNFPEVSFLDLEAQLDALKCVISQQNLNEELGVPEGQEGEYAQNPLEGQQHEEAAEEGAPAEEDAHVPQPSL